MINKQKQSRREALKMGVAAITVAGAATATSTALAQTKTPFAVKSTFIPIADSKDLFPVRRIYCIGRNYAAHSREMGSDPTDRKSTRLNSSHVKRSRMPSSA